jgi:hypothetical protein
MTCFDAVIEGLWIYEQKLRACRKAPQARQQQQTEAGQMCYDNRTTPPATDSRGSHRVRVAGVGRMV